VCWVLGQDDQEKVGRQTDLGDQKNSSDLQEPEVEGTETDGRGREGRWRSFRPTMAGVPWEEQANLSRMNRPVELKRDKREGSWPIEARREGR
jgi:hypothetical protein